MCNEGSFIGTMSSGHFGLIRGRYINKKLFKAKVLLYLSQVGLLAFPTKCEPDNEGKPGRMVTLHMVVLGSRLFGHISVNTSKSVAISRNPKQNMIGAH